jgi:hypothetical protein
MTATRYQCPLPTCGWTLEEPAPGVDDLQGLRPAEGAVTPEDVTASIAEQAARRRGRAVQATMAGHLDTHDAGEWAGALFTARAELVGVRAELDKARSWVGHWKYRAVAAGGRLTVVMRQHQRALDGGGLPSGLCTCGRAYPCETRKTLGVHRSTWQTCNCGPKCPAKP